MGDHFERGNFEGGQTRFTQALHRPTLDCESKSGLFCGKLQDVMIALTFDPKQRMKCPRILQTSNRTNFLVENSAELGEICFPELLFAMAQRGEVEVNVGFRVKNPAPPLVPAFEGR